MGELSRLVRGKDWVYIDPVLPSDSVVTCVGLRNCECFGSFGRGMLLISRHATRRLAHTVNTADDSRIIDNKQKLRKQRHDIRSRRYENNLAATGTLIKMKKA